MPLPAALLAELPDDLRAIVDLGEIGDQIPEAEQLGAELGTHVVTYRAGASPPAAAGRRHLCASLEMAPLSPPQLERLHAAERRHDVVLVAYVRPATPRQAPPARSATAPGRT